MMEVLERVWTWCLALPGPLKAALTLFIGWLAAQLMRFLTTGLLTLMRFDKLSERSGFDEFLRKGRVKYPPTKLLATVAWWIMMGTTLVLAAMALDQRIVSSLAESAIGFLPSLLAALIVSALGFVLIGFSANFIETLARNAAMPRARLLSRAVRVVGNLVIAMVAIDQMGMSTAILNSMILILFGGLVFGAALAFGLGCKDLARDSAQRMIRNLEQREREEKPADLEG